LFAVAETPTRRHARGLIPKAWLVTAVRTDELDATAVPETASSRAPGTVESENT